MKVKAKFKGFYANRRRKVGDVFFLKNAKEDFSKVWMEEVKPVKGKLQVKTDKKVSDSNSEVI